MAPRMLTGAEQLTIAVDIPALLNLIVTTQQPDGAIPWWPGHKTDPWDHTESAIGLTIGNAHTQARKAYLWLRENQLDDGSWYAAYIDGKPTDLTRETNHAAYPATGIYHYYLSTGDIDFVKSMWPTIRRAMDFVIRHQAPTGEIYWAVSPRGEVDPMALVTGCSSIGFSLKCALALAKILDEDHPEWRRALTALCDCLRHKPHRFNTTKARFSMDWFYPVLSGVLTARAAQDRIDSQWKKFVAQDFGVRCVSDRPWVTIAESSELVLALAAMGNHRKAGIVFRWICDRIYEDGTYWCGFTFPDMVVWPEEKISWTNAVVLMAADALFNLTPAADLFSHDRWLRLDI